MPTNLNALVRYKTIDNCLRNNTTLWTIEKLQEACTEATGEFRGLYKEISERTIRDDIRVMRSEILGFNAPIICKDGCYQYSDANYSIFDVPIRAKEVIERTIALLEEHIDVLGSNEAFEIMYQLKKLIGDSSDMEVQFSLSLANTTNILPQDVSSDRSKKVFKEKKKINLNWGRIYRLLLN